jgi:Domain found in IF2B/IF5
MCASFQELGTSGNLDGQQRLIVKGRFLPKGFENVIRRYMNEYVLCASCKSPDTLLDRDAGDRPLPMCIAADVHCKTMYWRLHIALQLVPAVTYHAHHLWLAHDTSAACSKPGCFMQGLASCSCGASSAVPHGRWQPSRYGARAAF